MTHWRSAHCASVKSWLWPPEPTSENWCDHRLVVLVLGRQRWNDSSGMCTHTHPQAQHKDQSISVREERWKWTTLIQRALFCVAWRFLTVFWKETNKYNMAPCTFEYSPWSLCPKCSCDLEGLLVLLMWSREPETHPSRFLEASLEHVTCGQLSLSVDSVSPGVSPGSLLPSLA